MRCSIFSFSFLSGGYLVLLILLSDTCLFLPLVSLFLFFRGSRPSYLNRTGPAVGPLKDRTRAYTDPVHLKGRLSNWTGKNRSNQPIFLEPWTGPVPFEPPRSVQWHVIICICISEVLLCSVVLVGRAHASSIDGPHMAAHHWRCWSGLHARARCTTMDWPS